MNLEALKKEIAENDAEMVRINDNLRKGLNLEGNPIDWGDIDRSNEAVDYLESNNEYLKDLLSDMSRATCSPVIAVNDYGMPNNIDLNDVPWRW